jgi:cytochrome oxidase Cu insertion factor (SCO1/SenC/PrrC family)
VAEKIRHTVDGLGQEGSRVAVLAVSTDPEGDTPQASRTFSAEHKMLHRWHYLTAPRARLARVWRAYYVYAAPPGASATLDSAHTSATYLIDASGRERVLMGGDLDATALDRDVRILAGLPLQKSPSDVAPEVGALAPEFTLRTTRGASLRLSSLRGKTVLINFWATWCTACRSEMPRLAAWYRQMKGRGLVVLGVDQQDDVGSVRAYARKLHIPYPVVLDSGGDVSARYNTVFLPTSLLVNQNGAVAAIKVGVLDQTFLRRQIRPLLSG